MARSAAAAFTRVAKAPRSGVASYLAQIDELEQASTRSVNARWDGLGCIDQQVLIVTCVLEQCARRAGEVAV